MTTGHSEETKR